MEHVFVVVALGTDSANGGFEVAGDQGASASLASKRRTNSFMCGVSSGIFLLPKDVTQHAHAVFDRNQTEASRWRERSLSLPDSRDRLHLEYSSMP